MRIEVAGALSVVLVLLVSMTQARAAECPIDHAQLSTALKSSVKASGGPANGGLENNEWASVVSRDGTVCAVVFSGSTVDDQWPGSRLISMQKANTANGFSLKNLSLSTANLFATAQPGQSLFGVIQSSPPPGEISAGETAQFGTPADPMVGKRSGGIIVFGGGLALFNDAGIVGALGVSGDSSCADHNVAWRVRHFLGLDKVPAGVNPQRKDAIIYDLNDQGKSASGYGHPKCAGTEADIADRLGAGVGGTAMK